MLGSGTVASLDGAGLRRSDAIVAEDLPAEKIGESRQAVPEPSTARSPSPPTPVLVRPDRDRYRCQARTSVSYAKPLDRDILPVLGHVKARALHRGLIKDLLARR
jgi:hypothetical protein